MDDFVPWHKRSPENAEAFRKAQRENSAAHYQRNKERVCKYKITYRQRNKERVRESSAAYYQRNKGRRLQHNINRKRGIQQASLFQHFAEQIEEFYREARRLTKETGVLHVVDHYWPIKGKASCGLHIPANLRVITQAENDSKGNKEPEDTWSSVTTGIGDNHGQSDKCFYYLRREGEPRGPE